MDEYRSAPPRWEQGDVLGEEAVAYFVQEGELPGGWGEDWIVVVSHSCDLASEDMVAEPTAEVLRARPIGFSELNGNYTWGKNPRRLQVAVEASPQAAALDIYIHERIQISRQRLFLFAPDVERSLTNEVRRLVARWLAKRYWRQAFPDTFNARLAPVADKLRDALKKEGGVLIAALYLVLNTEEELDAEIPYRVGLRAVMNVDDFENQKSRDKGEQALRKVVERLGEVEYVEVVDWNLVPASEMSLDDLNYYRRWDYDDLTARSPEAREAPEL